MIPALLCNLSHIHDFATFILQQNKGTFLFKGPWLSGMNFLAISDSMNVHYVLSKNFPNYPKGPEFREIFEPLGDGIFNSDSDSWSIQRRIFHSLLVKNKRFDLAVEITLRQKILNGLFPLLENVSQVDMQDVFQRFTFDNICRLVLGFDPNSLSIEFPEIAYQKAFDDIEEIIIYRHALPASIWKLQRWLQIGNEKKFKKSWKIFDVFGAMYYKKRESKMEEIWGKDCLEFKPERWISEGGRIKHVPSYKFVAFNAGPRSCIGKELAFLQMKAIAASVIWNYSLQVVENHSVSPNVSILLYTKRGLRLGF
ncbi:hypothetical protein GH714_022725 [Hevea brasiliensis]|uniref:Cytochrome P450 n=1 Tax=Hevea brasiliensis TaxID=3981 RepID=A0A6A6MYK9_HEVBR|nr:hypothetical protein GH714_022725 [Hevea brasiliensis]